MIFLLTTPQVGVKSYFNMVSCNRRSVSSELSFPSHGRGRLNRLCCWPGNQLRCYCSRIDATFAIDGAYSCNGTWHLVCLHSRLPSMRDRHGKLLTRPSILDLCLRYRDPKLFYRGLRNEAIGILLTFIFGILGGMVISGFAAPDWETTEMTARGDFAGLAPGVLIAIPCGMALGLSVSSADGMVLVGVAIAAALLPPIVNSGLSLAFGLVSV